jgi:hypothetical protein
MQRLAPSYVQLSSGQAALHARAGNAWMDRRLRRHPPFPIGLLAMFVQCLWRLVAAFGAGK